MKQAKQLKLSVSLVGLVFVLLFLVACAKSEKETAAPAPAASAAPATAAPAPAAATTPGAPVATTQPAVTAAAPGSKTAFDVFLSRPEGQPLVPGGPPFFPREAAKIKGVQIHYGKYHQTVTPLWTRAIYGGEFRASNTWNPISALDYLKVLSLARPTLAGMLLYMDMGLCSMVGRDDFSVCKGEYAHNYDFAVVPGVFQKWQQPDPVTYVFTMRQGVLWPAVPPMLRPDREVKAEDIVWFLQTTQKEGVLRGNLALVDKFEAVDRYTVRITMKEPQAEFIRNMTFNSMGIFPKECYDEKGCLGGKILSPSPFLLKESVPRQKVVLEKNPEFYLKGLPYVDRLIGIAVADIAADKAAFLTGQFDSLRTETDTDIGSIRRQIPNVRVHSAWTYGGMNAVTPQITGPLADVRVRRAMAMTMDHPDMWETGYEGHTAFPTWISKDWFGAEFVMSLPQAGEWYQFNPEKAKKLLAEAGYPNGFTVAFQRAASLVAADANMVTFLQASWKKHLNIDAQIKLIDGTALTQAIQQGKWEGMVWQHGHNQTYWVGADPNIQLLLEGSPTNFQRVKDPVIEDLYLRERREMDPAKRTALLWEFEQRELDQVWQFRAAVNTALMAMQPWDINGLPSLVGFLQVINAPSWLVMHDVSKEPKR
jgi:peptide/nickel transport system substrate-binding protein